MTEAQLKSKLEKVARLAVGGSTLGERAASIAALHRLCKVNAVRLTDYVTGLSEAFADIDYRKVPETEKKKSTKKASRRSLIIGFVQENIWDTASLADFLTVFGYNDLKANRKAVAGTLYDMQKNKGWDVRRSDDGRICKV